MPCIKNFGKMKTWTKINKLTSRGKNYFPKHNSPHTTTIQLMSNIGIFNYWKYKQPAICLWPLAFHADDGCSPHVSSYK